MPKIPALCPRCGFCFVPPGAAIFEVPAGARGVAISNLTIEGGGIEVGPGAEITLEEVGAGRCPRCRIGQAIYLNGLFRVQDDLRDLLKRHPDPSDALRRLGVVFTEAAKTSPPPSEVADRVKDDLPGFAEWLASVPFAKEAAGALFLALATTIATEVASLFHHPQPTTVINNFNATIIERVEKQSKYSPQERRRVIDETMRRLQQMKRAQESKKDRFGGGTDHRPEQQQ